MKSFTKFLNSRLVHFIIIPMFVVIWYFWTDPSHGADTELRLQLLAQAFLITGMSFLASKALMGRACSGDLYDATLTGNHAAAIGFAGVCVLRGLVLAAMLVFFAMVQR